MLVILEVELDPIYSKGKERQKRSTSRGYTNKVQGQLNNIPAWQPEVEQHFSQREELVR